MLFRWALILISLILHPTPPPTEIPPPATPQIVEAGDSRPPYGPSGCFMYLPRRTVCFGGFPKDR